MYMGQVNDQAGGTFKLDTKSTLIKAASLCREAAEKLRLENAPEKQASEIVDRMVDKGLISSAEKERYIRSFAQTPEKMANVSDIISSMPSRTTDIAEPGAAVSPQGADALERFMYT